MFLRPDGIVTQKKSNGKDEPSGKLRVVAGGTHKRNCCAGGLPAFELNEVEFADRFIEREMDRRIVSLPESVIDWWKVESAKVYAVESKRIHPLNGFLKRQTGPWTLSDFVGVVVDEPVGF